jgi:hypothetical protein
MTSEAKPDKVASEPAKTWRHFQGPRPVGALMPSVTRAAFKKRAPATATLLSEWGDIVGPALAAVTTPRRLSADSLAIGCTGPVAMELQHLAPQLIERINAHFGRVLVQRLRFVQDGMVPSVPTPRLQPTAEIAAAADRAVAALPPGDLRDALAALGRAMLSEHAVRSPNPPPIPPRSTAPEGSG